MKSRCARSTLLIGGLVCSIWMGGCDPNAPAPEQDTDETPGTECPAEGQPFECRDPRGCIRIEQDGSFENEFSDHWDGDLDDGDQDIDDLRRVGSVTVAVPDPDSNLPPFVPEDIVEEEGDTRLYTIRPCAGQLMLSFGWNPGGCGAKDVSQEIDISAHAQHISNRSLVIVQVVYNLMPVAEACVNGTVLELTIRSLRDGDLVDRFDPTIWVGSRPTDQADEPLRWEVAWRDLQLDSGVDAVEILVRGVSDARSVDQLFVDDVRVWLELNAPDAELALSMAADPAYQFIGQMTTFTTTVTNRGTEPARDIRVIVTLPSGVSYQNHAGDGGFLPSERLWVLGELQAGQSATLAIDAMVTSLEQITVVAEAEITGGLLGDFDEDDNEAEAALHINQANPTPPPANNEGTVEHGCRDGVDNDGDGLVDCEDPQCLGRADCPETCSNGVVDTDFGEECDDGNLTNGDGCSSRCLVE